MSLGKEFDIFNPTAQAEPQPTVAAQASEEAVKKQQEYLALMEKRLQGKVLYVATPMYGGQCNGAYMKSCLDLALMCARINVPIKFKFIFNESLIQRARNYLVDEFFRSEGTHLLFIDADISFNARNALELLAFCGETDKGSPRYDIIAGPYPKKAIAWEKVLDAAKSGLADQNPMILSKFTADFAFNPVGAGEFSIDKPVEVSEAGTGFMCISKDAIDKFRRKYPKQKYTPDHARTPGFDGSRPVYAVFDCLIDPDSNRYLSEDYMFCQWSRAIGLHVWVCPWMELGHAGTYTFKGSIPWLAQLGKPMNPSGIDPEHADKMKEALQSK